MTLGIWAYSIYSINVSCKAVSASNAIFIYQLIHISTDKYAGSDAKEYAQKNRQVSKA